MDPKTDNEEFRSHLEGFPERQQRTDERFKDVSAEIAEMRNEWREFKGRALSILLGGLVVMVGYGVWVGTIQSSIKNNEVLVAAQVLRVAEIERRQQTTDITNAEIKAKLVNIELGLVDIKESIKTLNTK